MSNNLPAIPGQIDNFSEPNAYLSNYYKKTFPIDSQKYDAVLAFFLRRTKGEKTSAEALSSTIMVIAQNKGIDPLLLIDQFKNIKEETAFQAALIALINSDRRVTSKLGFTNRLSPNPYTERNIGK